MSSSVHMGYWHLPSHRWRFHSLPDGRYPLFNQIGSWELSSQIVSAGWKGESDATVTFLEIDLFWRWYRYCCYCMLLLSFLFLLELLRITIYISYVCVAKKRVWTGGIWTCVPKLRNCSVAPKKTSLNKKEIFMEMTKFSEVRFFK